MNRHTATEIGTVRQVLGATVKVALAADLAGVAPIYRGHLQPLGQTGSFVRIPQGQVDLVASVTQIGITALTTQPESRHAASEDERWLQVQLLGEVDRATGCFRRGVGTYPGLDDPVHFTTSGDLDLMFPPEGANYLKIGHLSTNQAVPVTLDVDRLVARHGAVVGATGSGKTSATAALLQGLLRTGHHNSRIVVVDPHGEYRSALSTGASVRSVLETNSERRLRVPYWMLPAREMLSVLTGGAASVPATNRFCELVLAGRQEFAGAADWLAVDPGAITADTPIPFDIRTVWYQFDYENRETRNSKDDPASVCAREQGCAESLEGAVFDQYGPAGASPHKAPTHGLYGASPARLRRGLKDPQLRFLQDLPNPNCDEPLAPIVMEWLGAPKPVSVLDFSGVPERVADVAIGLVLSLLFELALHGSEEGDAIGVQNPLLIVLEESHRYLGKQAGELALVSVNRIAREGRKYGIGLMLVTQRPSELPETALAQCGTILALRLSSVADQSAVRAGLPDNSGDIAAVLPTLRTHEALLSGEAVALPVRVTLTTPSPWPRAEDPSLESWRAEGVPLEVGSAIRRWRTKFE